MHNRTKYKCKTINALEDGIEENPGDLEFGNDFLNKKNQKREP